MAWDDEEDAERAFWEAEDARHAQAEAAAGYVQCVHGNVRAFCEQCEQEQQ